MDTKVGIMFELKISVIVCTYNRCESLRDTLIALAAQKTEANITWELIVVDNNSHDATKTVCAEESLDYPVQLRYCFEGRQGLSAARNRGLQEAKGEFVLFTDDDVMPEPNWVDMMCQTFVDHNADCVSGKILPAWDCDPPLWLKENQQLLGELAMLDLGDQMRVMTMKFEGYFVLGANMGFRKSKLSPNSFDEQLGVKGNLMLRGEETQLVMTMFQKNDKIIYQPLSRVHHKVPTSRMNMKYFKNLRFWAGVSNIKIDPLRYPKLPYWMVKEAFTHYLKSFIYKFRDYKQSVLHEILFWFQFGQIYELIRQRILKCGRKGVVHEV